MSRLTVTVTMSGEVLAYVAMRDALRQIHRLASNSVGATYEIGQIAEQALLEVARQERKDAHHGA